MPMFGEKKMKRRHAILLTAAVMLGGCMQSEPESEQFDQIILFDVQGLWGGQDLWISGDGNAVCRFVASPTQGQTGLHETRYNFTLSAQQQTTLLQLVKKHRFFTLKTTERDGVPDEAHPIIFVRSGARSHSVGKWANEKRDDFDPIYQFLLQIIDSGRNGKHGHSGPLEWGWRPDGFPENRSIREATRPEPNEK